MATRNANGRATKVDTPDAITAKGAILGATLKDSQSVAPSQVRRFKGWLALLADLCVSEERVQRIRETTDEYEIDNPDLCRDCLEYPAANAGRCFRCLSGRAA